MTTSHAAPDHASHAAFDRFVDSQPIIHMLNVLSQAGRSHFNEHGAWEVCLCALVLKLEPQCRVRRILEALPRDPVAMDEAALLNTMAHLGYVGRPADCEMTAIDERLLPGLFIPGSGTPCIVLGRDVNGQLQFFDPLSRLVSLAPPSLDKDGRVWFFQPFDDQMQATSKFMRKGNNSTWFRALLGRFDSTFTQVMAAGLILNLIALATPLFIMVVYDRVIAAGTSGPLPMLVLGALITIGFEWRLRVIRSTGLSWIAGRLDNIVGNRIFAHLIGLPPSLIETASVPAQIARIKTFEAVRDFFSGSVFLSLLEAPFVVLSLAAIIAIAGPLAVVPAVVLALYAGLFALMRRQVAVSIRIAAKASSARQQFTIETFEKLDAIRAQGLDDKWQDKFRHLSGREMMSHFHLGWLGMVSETAAHALTVLAGTATIGFGVHLIWAGSMTTGALVAAMILVWRVLTPFYALCTMVPRLEQIRNSIAQVNELMDIETEAATARSFSRLPSLRGGVAFHNASFRYTDDGDHVFTNLSFEARPGDLVVVTGGNGTGKGTLLKLILSMYRADSGTVRIDGFDIRQLDATDLRRQIAYVPKTPHIFHGTVTENLRLGNPTATPAQMRAALEKADLWDEVSGLADGPDTLIGAHGAIQPTASFATRLSLARAYLHPAAILLIDDLPNALMSGKAGRNLRDHIVRAKGKQTIILCTYRDDFMKLADTIVWLRGLDSPVCGPRDMIRDKIRTAKGVAA